jgi:V/A-type H+-transporting ATPase subunit A
MMKVVGEEGTVIDDFLIYLKSEYLDGVYLQQDAYHDVDCSTTGERQVHVFSVLAKILQTPLSFDDKEKARTFFHQLSQTTRDWNRVEMDSPEFKTLEKKLAKMVAEVAAHAESIS